MAVVNGKLPASMLVAIPGGQLRADAAASWLRLRAAVQGKHGWAPSPTSYHDSYRSYEWQERIFRQRYTTSYVTGIDPRSWQGKTWWRLPGTASAATPGRSNHGLGVAVDVPNLGGFNGTRYKQFAALAGAHGWDNNTGRKINEPWHWEYTPANDKRRNETPLPTVVEKDWFDMATETELRNIVREEFVNMHRAVADRDSTFARRASDAHFDALRKSLHGLLLTAAEGHDATGRQIRDYLRGVTVGSRDVAASASAVAALAGQVAGLQEALRQAGTGSAAVDVRLVEAASKRGAEAALANLRLVAE